jgi:hypothetical protein
MPKKVVVSTYIVDQFDVLKEFPKTEGIEYQAFVDTPVISTTWQSHLITRQFIDPRREARMYKLLAHQFFPDADYTIWLDGSISVTGDLATLLDEVVDHDWDLATFSHPERDCLYVEARVCKALNTDAPYVIDQQLAKCRACGFPEHAGSYEPPVLIRRRNDRGRNFNNTWWSEVCTHSRRDQVSMPYAANLTGLRIGLLPGNPRNLAHIHPRRSGNTFFA